MTEQYIPHAVSKMAWNCIKAVGDLAVEDNGFDALMVFIVKALLLTN